MDRYFTVRFWRIEHGRGAKEPMSDIFTKLMHLEEASRVRTIESVPFWADKLQADGSSFVGRLCREQSENLPPKALPQGRLVPLGIPTIGRTAAFKYDPTHSILAMESSREGVGHRELLRYLRVCMDVRGYAAYPVLEGAELEALRTGRIRGFSVQVATPANLETITPEQVSVKEGFKTLMSEKLGSRVQVSYSLELGDKDMSPAKVSRLVKWLRGEREAARGGITKIQARVVDEDGLTKDIEFTEAQMQERSELTVPDDDPDKSYEVRRAFVATALRRKAAEIARQFRE